MATKQERNRRRAAPINTAVLRSKSWRPTLQSISEATALLRFEQAEHGRSEYPKVGELGLSSVTCEILLDGLCKQGRNVEACVLLINFSRKGVVPSKFDLSTLVDSLSRRGFAGRALEVVYELWRNGKAPSLICSTTLVEGLRKSGMTEDVFRLMEKLLKESSIVPDVITFNWLIRDVCKSGRTSDANELMVLGCSKGLEPDWMTYDVLVSGYTAEGKRKEGEGLVDEMLYLR
ncbi:Pentatricopeptide repeat-containing protein At2g36240 [Linum perenne]